MASKGLTQIASASFLLLSSLTALPGQAIDIISNFPSNDFSFTFLGQTSVKAAGFTMPSGLPYSLDSAKVSLSVSDLTAQSAWSFDLYANNSGNPDMTSKLASFILPTLTTGQGIYTLTPASSFTLQPDTTYWLAGSSSAASGIGGWNYSSPGVTPTGLATNAGYRFGNPPTSSSGNLNSYSIQATLIQPPAAVPGPVPLLGAGVSLGFSRRLRCRIQMCRP
jgi:hypothetical protein